MNNKLFLSSWCWIFLAVAQSVLAALRWSLWMEAYDIEHAFSPEERAAAHYGEPLAPGFLLVAIVLTIVAALSWTVAFVRVRREEREETEKRENQTSIPR